MCKNICLCYLVERAVDWFKDNEKDSASWRLGRLAVENNLNKVPSNMLHYLLSNTEDIIK